MSWVGVITDAGNALFASYAQTGTALSIDSVKVGSGTMDVEEMRGATALVSQKDVGAVETMESVSGGAQFRLRIGPASAEIGSYVMKEIGLFINGTSGSGTTTVMAAYFLEIDDGIAIPLAANFPDFAYLLSATLAISNSTEISLTVNPQAYVSFASMEAYVQDLILDFGTVSSLPQTISNLAITSDMAVVGYSIADEEAFSALSVTVTAGSAVLSGTINSGASSAVKIMLTHGNSVSAS